MRPRFTTRWRQVREQLLDAGEGVFGIASSNVGVNSCGTKLGPEYGRQRVEGHDKEVDVSCRSNDSVRRQGSGSNDRERDLAVTKERRNLPEQQTQPMSSSMHLDRIRPDCRRRSRT